MRKGKKYHLVNDVDNREGYEYREAEVFGNLTTSVSICCEPKTDLKIVF